MTFVKADLEELEHNSKNRTLYSDAEIADRVLNKDEAMIQEKTKTQDLAMQHQRWIQKEFELPSSMAWGPGSEIYR